MNFVWISRFLLITNVVAGNLILCYEGSRTRKCPVFEPWTINTLRLIFFCSISQKKKRIQHFNSSCISLRVSWIASCVQSKSVLRYAVLLSHDYIKSLLWFSIWNLKIKEEGNKNGDIECEWMKEFEGMEKMWHKTSHSKLNTKLIHSIIVYPQFIRYLVLNWWRTGNHSSLEEF